MNIFYQDNKSLEKELDDLDKVDRIWGMDIPLSLLPKYTIKQFEAYMRALSKLPKSRLETEELTKKQWDTIEKRFKEIEDKIDKDFEEIKGRHGL